MDLAEKSYQTCEKEALVVVFALRQFSVFFLSPDPLIMITDHQALGYAFGKK